VRKWINGLGGVQHTLVAGIFSAIVVGGIIFVCYLLLPSKIVPAWISPVGACMSAMLAFLGAVIGSVISKNSRF